MTFTNGNREIQVSEVDGIFQLISLVFDGVKWQSRRLGEYKTEKMAIKKAEKKVAEISTGWTAFPEWTITQ